MRLVHDLDHPLASHDTGTVKATAIGAIHSERSGLSAAAGGKVKVKEWDKFKTENHLTAVTLVAYNESVIASYLAASSFIWGRHGFDGGKDSWDACRGPSPRKSGGTQRNCGHAARSRCLNSSDVHPELACRAGLDVIKAGWPPRAVPTRGRRDDSGLAPGGFGRPSTSGANFQERLRM
jgi:hypothetical protein